MLYSNHNYAYFPSVTFPKTYNSQFASRDIRIYTDDVHTGYVRLIKGKDNTELLMSDLHKQSGNQKIHGPAIWSENKEIVDKIYSLSKDAEVVKDFTFKHIDMVYAVRSPYWPVEANEWIM